MADSGSDYRFLNPYNFIRWLPLPKKSDDVPSATLLGRATPPPHDRWVGLTGRINIRLEAVTPLFVSDPQSIYASDDDKTKNHRTYRFFRYDFGNGPERAIPAASLRGMIRSVFETVTNSCYAHFDYDRRLSYRLSPTESLKLVPGRLERRRVVSKDNPNEEQSIWQLRLLPGTARVVVGERPRGQVYAAKVERYDALQPAGRGYRTDSDAKIDLGDLKHGDLCHAVLEKGKFAWNVVAIARDAKSLREKIADGQSKHERRTVNGCLCVTGQNIEPKRFERLFFWTHESSSDPRVLPVRENVVDRYEQLINDYRSRHADEVARWRGKGLDPAIDPPKPPDRQNALSAFIVDKASPLEDSVPVYAYLSGSDTSSSVEFIAPVAIPRVGYENMIHELLPAHMKKCHSYDALCPACRTFGWVAGSDDDVDEDTSTRVAYAGRVKLSHAREIELRGEPIDASLAILSAPKPTTTRFYLGPQDRPPRDGRTDFEAGYDNPSNVIRGRKAYRHHGHEGDSDYWRSGERELRKRGKNSDQNRSVEDLVPVGSTFEFTLDFENLTHIELGALLWSLELDGSAVHRLGYGKPLGLGSVRLSYAPQEVELLDVRQRYGVGGADGWNREQGEVLARCTDSFTKAMEAAYGSSFVELPNIEDLLAIQTAEDESDALPIHYPRTTRQASEEGKNFEWFMGNNRQQAMKLALARPREDEGFPLMDKHGSVK